MVWQKLLERRDEGYRGVMHGDESLDPLAGKSSSTSGHQLPDELKISESQFSLAPGDATDADPRGGGVVGGVGGVGVGGMDYANLSSSVQNHTSKTANGSIITMTLKNNHLIVETEERGPPPTENTVSTTKFTTTTSPGRNNVFVVEVQHTTIESSASSYPGVTSALSSQEEIYDIDEDVEEDSRHSSSQQVQVHQPPDDLTDPPLATPDPDPEPEPPVATPNTGLSQSDLSISSAGSNNPSYRYGNQLAYDGGHFGYPQYAGYTAEEVSTYKSSHSNNSMSTPLLDEDDSHQSEQMKLGNGDADGEVRGLPQGEVKVVKALVEDVKGGGRRGPMIKSGFFQSKTAEKSAFNKICRDTLDEIEKDGDRKNGVES